MPNPIRVAVQGDVSDLQGNLSRGGDSLREFEDKAERAGRNVGESVDNAGSKFATLGGAIGDIGGGLESVGLGGFGEQLNKLAPIMMLGAGAADVFTLANESLNLTFLANPITIVILAIVALVAIFVVAYKKSDTFRAIVNNTFEKIKDTASNVMEWFTSIPEKFGRVFDKITGYAGGALTWFKSHWPLLLAILTGPIGLAVLVIAKHWDDIKAGGANMLHFVEGLGDKVGRAGISVANGFIGMFNSIIGGWNSLDFGIHVKLPDFLGGAGFDVDDLIPDIPQIPRLARGGIVIAGDNPSGIEAVVPLERAGAMGFGGGGNHYAITVKADATSNPAEVGRAVVEAIDAFERAGGRRRAG